MPFVWVLKAKNYFLLWMLPISSELREEVRETGYSSFKLESLYLNLKERKLVINGKEIPLSGITDFTLTTQGAGWHISGRRDIIFEVCEEHDCQDRANQEAEQQRPR